MTIFGFKKRFKIETLYIKNISETFLKLSITTDIGEQMSISASSIS